MARKNIATEADIESILNEIGLHGELRKATGKIMDESIRAFNPPSVTKAELHVFASYYSQGYEDARKLD